jgi:hypothetical protein
MGLNSAFKGLNVSHGVVMHYSVRLSRDLVVDSVFSECAPPLQKYDDVTLLFNQP